MFVKAERKNVKLKLAITGISGSGKTYSSLILAKSLGEKIALVCTENGSANLYSEEFSFDIAKMNPPYSVEKYIMAIDKAIELGYQTIIIDSLSHAWNAEGGVLDLKAKKDMRGGNSFSNWGEFTSLHNKLISKILSADINIICTMRSKTEYILSENEKGKMAPKKVGLAPIQREGVDYEFSIVFDLAENHLAQVSKDRSGLFDGQIFKIDDEIGKKINDWLNK